MNPIVLIEIEWVYTPEDYFYKKESIPIAGGGIVIKDGVVKAKIDPEVFASKQSLVNELDDLIENFFHDQQIKIQKPYELSMPFLVITREDGSTEVTYAWRKLIIICLITLALETLWELNLASVILSLGQFLNFQTIRNWG